MAEDNVFEEACRRIHDGKSSVNAEKRRIHAAAGTIRTYYKALYGTDCPKAKPEIALPEEEKRRREAVREAAIRIHNGETYISTEVKRLGTTKQTLDHYHQEMYGCPCPRLNRRGRKKKEPGKETPPRAEAVLREAARKIHDGEASLTGEAKRLHVASRWIRERYAKMYGENPEAKSPDWALTDADGQAAEERAKEVQEAVRRIHDGESTVHAETVRIGTKAQTLDKYHDEMYGTPCPRQFREVKPDVRGEIREAVRRIHDGESTAQEEKTRMGTTLHALDKYYEEAYGEPCPRTEDGTGRNAETQEACRRIHDAESNLSTEAERLHTSTDKLRAAYLEKYGKQPPMRQAISKTATVGKHWFEVIGKVKTYELTHTKAAELLHMTPTEMRTLYEKATGERLDRIWPHWRDFLKDGVICWPAGKNPMAANICGKAGG